MLKKELIEENKNLLKQNGQLMYLLEFGKLRCENGNGQMLWEYDSNARLLQQRISNAIEYIGSREMYNDDFDTETNKLLAILKGEKNEL